MFWPIVHALHVVASLVRASALGYNGCLMSLISVFTTSRSALRGVLSCVYHYEAAIFSTRIPNKLLRWIANAEARARGKVLSITVRHTERIPHSSMKHMKGYMSIVRGKGVGLRPVIFIACPAYRFGRNGNRREMFSIFEDRLRWRDAWSGDPPIWCAWS
uniref:Putative secreted protein n=1 Tax=Anopheles marajoara TaxID=58244 RepID=A0A2M4C753_9DIPT